MVCFLTATNPEFCEACLFRLIGDSFSSSLLSVEISAICKSPFVNLNETIDVRMCRLFSCKLNLFSYEIV